MGTKIPPIACVFLAAVPLAILNVFMFFAALPALQGYVDFRHLYTAGHMTLSGHSSQLYDYDATLAAQNEVVSPGSMALPFNHLAYEALLLSPLSLLPYRTAYFVFAIVNLILLALSFRILRPYFGDLSCLPRWLPLALPLGFLPTTFAISEGQDSILLLLLMSFACVLLAREREREAGAVLALTLFKFQFALPIAFLYLCWRRWRFVEGFLGCTAIVVTLSFAMVGPASAAAYVKELLLMSVRLSAQGQVRYGIHPELMMNLRGFIYLLGHEHFAPAAIQVITVVLSLAALIWCSTRRPSFPFAVAVAVLVSYHCFTDDAVLLLIPLATIIGKRSVLIAGAVLSAPTLLLCIAHTFPLMVIPLVAMILRLASVNSRLPNEEPRLSQYVGADPTRAPDMTTLLVFFARCTSARSFVAASWRDRQLGQAAHLSAHRGRSLRY